VSRPPSGPTQRRGTTAAEAALLGLCPHCGRPLPGRPNRCPYCGRLLGEAQDDLKKVAAEERAILARRKNVADGLFLAGLLVGGPLLSLGGRTRLGLFVLLGGAAASGLYRWARSSLPAALLIGGLAAGVVAVAVTNPSGTNEDEVQVQADARGAYVGALAHDLEPLGGLAEARGPDGIIAWLQLPPDETVGCGSYPDAQTRIHLAQLGFVRVVIANETAQGVVCSFKP
jgi:hypothetical protein